jgi:WD40 repeat protein
LQVDAEDPVNPVSTAYEYEDDDVEFGYEASDPDEAQKQSQALASAAVDGNRQLIQRLVRQGASLSRTAAQANALSSETKQHISACIAHRMLDLQKQYEHSNEMYCNSLQHPKDSVITAMCTLTEHGCLAATACEDGSIHIWCYADNMQPELVFDARSITQCQTELRRSIAAHYSSVTALCSIPKGNKSSAVLASCSTDGTIKLWTIDGSEVGYMRCMTKQLIITTSLSGHTILAACNSNIELWNLDTDSYCKWQPCKYISYTFYYLHCTCFQAFLH